MIISNLYNIVHISQEDGIFIFELLLLNQVMYNLISIKGVSYNV